MNRIITFEYLKAEVKKRGSHLTFDDDIELKMTELPNGIQSITVEGNSFDGYKLTKLPDGITIKVDRHVWLDGLTAIGENVTIDAGMNIWLNGLETIGNNVTIKTKYSIVFNEKDTGIKEITLTDDGTVPNEVKQFLIDKNITVKCSEHSQLVNLAFDGVKVEITS